MVWRPSVCLSVYPVSILAVTHQRAACGAASAHFGRTLRTDIILLSGCRVAISDVIVDWNLIIPSQKKNVTPVVMSCHIICNALFTVYVPSGVQRRFAASDTRVCLWRCDSSYKGENVPPPAGRLSGQDHWHGNTGWWVSEEIGSWHGWVGSCRGRPGTSLFRSWSN